MTSGPSQDGHLHPGGAPLPQDPAAFPGRGPGGEHVIDEQDPSAGSDPHEERRLPGDFSALADA